MQRRQQQAEQRTSAKQAKHPTQLQKRGDINRCLSFFFALTEEEEVKMKHKLEQHLNKAKKLVGDRDWKKEVLGEKEDGCSQEKQ